MKVHWIIADAIYTVFVALVILIVTPYDIADWQFWGMFLALVIGGMVYGDVKKTN